MVAEARTYTFRQLREYRYITVDDDNKINKKNA